METREKAMLVVLVVAAAVVGYLYLLKPGWNSYVEQGEKIDKNVAKIRESLSRAADLNQLISDYREVQKKLNIAQRKLPREGEFFDLLAKLEQKAQDSGIPSKKIRTFSRGSERTRGDYREMLIQARFSRISLGNFVSLLWSYRQMERLVDFQKVNLEPVSGSETFNVSLELVVYMLQKNMGEEE